MKRADRRIPAKAKARAIVVYLPQKLIPLLNAVGIKSGKDRDRFIRQAVREKIGRTTP